ncbi:hypothetical protein ES708_08921 [subsurface metagenome]
MKALGNWILYSGGVGVLLVKSVSMLGHGSGRSVLGAGCWVGFGCGVASWELGVGCCGLSTFASLRLTMRVTSSGLRVSGFWSLMPDSDFWFSALDNTLPEEEDFEVFVFVVISFGTVSLSCAVVITVFSIGLFIVISLIFLLVSVAGLVNSNTPAVVMVRRPATYQAFKVVGVNVKKFLQASFEEIFFHSPDEGSTRKLLKLSL